MITVMEKMCLLDFAEVCNEVGAEGGLAITLLGDGLFFLLKCRYLLFQAKKLIIARAAHLRTPRASSFRD